MDKHVLLLLSPATDPSPYQFSLESTGKFGKIDYVTGDTKDGFKEGISAFNNGYRVVVADLLLSTPKYKISRSTDRARVLFDGLELLDQGNMLAMTNGGTANYVILSEWYHPSNVYEAYRRKAKAFLSKKHPLPVSDFIEATSKAADGITSYPGMNHNQINVAKAVTHSVFNDLSIVELEIVSLLVSKYSTDQITSLLDSKSPTAVSERINKIFRKLQVTRRSDLVRIGKETGMTSSLN